MSVCEYPTDYVNELAYRKLALEVEFFNNCYELGRQAGLEEAADCGEGSHVVAWAIEDKIRAKLTESKIRRNNA